MCSDPSVLDDEPAEGPLTEAAARALLHRWILARNEDLDASALTGQTPLLSTRYLRSVHLPELILLLERVRGVPIEVEELGAGDFRDIDTIVAGFLVPVRPQGPAS